MLKNKKIYFFTVMFFLILILLGAILLKLPICSNTKLNIIDALFEATAGISATGTAVFDISQNFTFFGQLVLLCLVQVGAIGFMTFFYFLFMLSKKKMKLSDTLIIANETNINDYQMIKITIKKILRYTFAIEFIGAWLLSFRFVPIYGFAKGLWYSVFHSVSAYCNAGFDLLGSDSLQIINSEAYLKCVIIVLMFLGSLGFFVLEELIEWFCTGKSRKLSVQSRIILIVSFAIVVIGTILLKIFDGNIKFLDALFSIVSARNTGFYTINMNQLSGINQLLIISIMFIGGGPVSNAGGIRVNVFAILILTAISNLKNQDEIVVSYRSINDKIVKRCITIVIVDVFIIIIGVMLFTLTDGEDVFDVLFYIVSTFSTTGLTTIDVSQISFAGKCISIFIMYIGRIAPITFMSLVIPTDEKNSGIKYPSMDVML